jgi:hypothetical protein
MTDGATGTKSIPSSQLRIAGLDMGVGAVLHMAVTCNMLKNLFIHLICMSDIVLANSMGVRAMATDSLRIYRT